MSCRNVTFWIAVVCLAPSTPPALAANPPAPAIAQYVETFPSAEGANVSGFGKTQVRKLPKPVAQRVEAEAGADAAALTIIATSSQYGAPQSTLHLAPKHVIPKHLASKRHVYVKHRPEQRAAASGAASAAPATATLTSGSGDSSIAGLGIVLVLVTAAMAAVGIRNR